MEAASSSSVRAHNQSEFITSQTEQHFCLVSGGFATVQPNSVLSINAVEGYPLEDFSAEAVRSQIAEAQKVANGSGSEQDITEAKIELEVRAMVPPLSIVATNNCRFWRVCRLSSNRLYKPREEELLRHLVHHTYSYYNS